MNEKDSRLLPGEARVTIDRETSAAIGPPSGSREDVPTLERSTRIALAFFALAGLTTPAAVAFAVTFY